MVAEVWFTENVSRHGSRPATDTPDGDAILALWDRASSEGRTHFTRTGVRAPGARPRSRHGEDRVRQPRREGDAGDAGHGHAAGA
ncbi:histidine acid phosphatase [Streptomyces bottropensis ATCC 25435]|uniref:Histidine acid phosphatase n=1 Tax=Streptomyces bottropensis ATCC 25435 TaxID=1054862 RepID=M3FSQ9_9ACTN|nr:histidine acid phosphatase [Streptomyces bottropensis ATCC 25435]